jgi:hypothetical protein
MLVPDLLVGRKGPVPFHPGAVPHIAGKAS